MADYGIDTDCVVDLPRRRVQANPRRNLANALARRLTNRRGCLRSVGDDPNYGYDVRDLLHSNTGQGSFDQAKADITHECQKDERVQTVTVEMDAVAPGTTDATLRFRITVYPADELAPFPFILEASALTSEILYIPPEEA